MADLRNIATQCFLKVSGRKSDLIGRIAEYAPADLLAAAIIKMGGQEQPQVNNDCPASQYPPLPNLLRPTNYSETSKHPNFPSEAPYSPGLPFTPKLHDQRPAGKNSLPKSTPPLANNRIPQSPSRKTDRRQRGGNETIPNENKRWVYIGIYKYTRPFKVPVLNEGAWIKTRSKSVLLVFVKDYQVQLSKAARHC